MNAAAAGFDGAGKPRSAAAPSEPVSKAPARLTPLREEQLLVAWRDGDPDALSELLTGYQNRIWSICYRMLNDRDEAADLTQESLTKVLEGLPSYAGRSRLSTWVIRVTMNCCLSHLRKKKYRRHASLDATDATTGESLATRTEGTGEHAPLARIEQAEERALLLEALGRLEPQARSIIVLRDLQGLDYSQLTDVLDVAEGTVKSRLFRARAALREMVLTLQRDDDDDDAAGNQSESGRAS